jgi:hypothetical protein
MKVFMSSVRRGLEEERDNLASVLAAMGHVPVRFEDFGAVNATSRVACLEAVRTADVYLLLLGPWYGTPTPDTGLSPTEEEFNTARTSGVPVLVFRKGGIDPEPAQARFSERVGSYTDGRFWSEFSALSDLVPAAISAVRGLPARTPSVSWRATTGPAIAPVHDQTMRRSTIVPQSAAILEVHVLPVEPVTLRRESSNTLLREQVIASMRRTHFIEPGAPATGLNEPSAVHVQRPSDPAREGHGFAARTTDPYRGVRLSGAGEGAAYSALPWDTLGSLTDLSDMTGRVQELLEQVIPFVPEEAQDLAVASFLIDEGRTDIGDPSQVGHRSSGMFGFGRSDIALPADRAVSRSALVAQPFEVARDVAARMCEALRDRR